MPVQGFVHVVGSSTVNCHSIVSASTRVKRSIRCRFAPEPLKVSLSEKLVVSTTSVSPSQWPRESPFHWLMPAPMLRAAVQGDDANVVDHLGENHHVARSLENLMMVVVVTCLAIFGPADA